MGWDDVKRGFGQGYPTSHTLEVYFPTSQLSIEIILDEVEVLISRFLVEDREFKIFAKTIRSSNGKDIRKLVPGIGGTILREKDFRL